jgi:hypothetical protein
LSTRIPKENLAYDGLLRIGPSSSLRLVEGKERKPPYVGEERDGYQNIDEAKAPPVHESILSGHFGDEGYKRCPICLSKWEEVW